MIELSKQELIDEFRKVKAHTENDVILNHTDYLHFVEAQGSAFIDKYINNNESVLEDALSILCQSNSDTLANENCVFLYFHISSQYTIDDVVKNMDIVYDTCNEESAIAFSIAFNSERDKDFLEVTLIMTGV